MRVLIIGAAGNFGKRLSRLLVKEEQIEIILAGRRLAPLQALQQELGVSEIVSLDRSMMVPNFLTELQIDIVVDASGPFDLEDVAVIESAIQSGTHYVDIADDRAFVAAIDRFESRAKNGGIHVISGASSTPGLSGAAVRHMTSGWKQVDRIRVAISPSNRQPRGLAVVESILGNAGKTLKIFEDGKWQNLHGWGNLRKIQFPGVGNRWASLVPTPDLDLLVQKHKPKISAEFYASLELSILHLGLWALSFLVRWRVISSLRPLAGPLKWIADRLEPFGNDMGGMIVEAEGLDAKERAIKSRWWLSAKGDIGPNVPILGALGSIRKIRDGMLSAPGTIVAADLLSLADYDHDFDTLGMEIGEDITHMPPSNLFDAAMQSTFHYLPATTQKLHSPVSTLTWNGGGNARRGDSIGARLLAAVFRFPEPTDKAPIKVIIERKPDGSEHWSRVWPDAIMRSKMKNADPRRGSVEEHFGPFAFVLKLHGDENGIDMKLESGRLFGIRLPRFLLPDIEATERSEYDRHLFDVKVTLPMIGLLTHYQGWLRKSSIQ